MIGSIKPDYTPYLHTYEAFRVPKDSEAMKAPGAELIKGEGEESALVLTKEAQKQLVKDRMDYGQALSLNAQMASAASGEEASKQANDDMAKIWKVFRSLCKGDYVPASDERKLLEYDDKMYQMAKNAQMIAINNKRKKKKSEWDEEEEKQKKAKLDELNAQAEQAFEDIGTGSREFADAQKGQIVEIPSDSVDMSAISSFTSLGSGVYGASFDISI